MNALRWVENVQPDILLSGLIFAGVTGLEIIRQTRKLSRQTHSVVPSAQSSDCPRSVRLGRCRRRVGSLLHWVHLPRLPRFSDTQEFRHRTAQRVCQPVDALQGQIAIAGLHPGNIGSMKSGAPGQLFLGDGEILSHRFNRRTERDIERRFVGWGRSRFFGDGDFAHKPICRL